MMEGPGFCKKSTPSRSEAIKSDILMGSLSWGGSQLVLTLPHFTPVFPFLSPALQALRSSMRCEDYSLMETAKLAHTIVYRQIPVTNPIIYTCTEVYPSF